MANCRIIILNLSKNHGSHIGMLERQSTTNLVNRILNDRSVLPWVAGGLTPPLDAGPIIANANNVVLACDGAAFLFIKLMVGYYELHSCVLPELRGRGTLQLGNEAVDWMFSRTDATEIITRVPHGNAAAKAAIQVIGIKSWFTTGPYWPLASRKVPMDVFRLNVLDWVLLRAEKLRPIGHTFHERLVRAGGAVDHPDDPIHDAYVGAASLMIDAGLPDKAVAVYDIWAAMAGYGTISVVSRDPLVIDIGTGVIMPKTGEFRRREAA